MLDSSQGIHPLESDPPQTFCVASATHGSLNQPCNPQLCRKLPGKEAIIANTCAALYCHISSQPDLSRGEYRAFLDRHGIDYDERYLWG
ncbi:MAG: hypothetical protein L0387_18355 [Acidobacteria bacterium]|nr:hypothetical protein [Acidobacteriota bacterium]